MKFNRLVNNLNYTIEGVSGANLTESLGNKVAFSTGSACSSGDIEPSYVLKAIGLDDQAALFSFRISVGRHTSLDDVDRAATIISKQIKILIN